MSEIHRKFQISIVDIWRVLNHIGFGLMEDVLYLTLTLILIFDSMLLFSTKSGCTYTKIINSSIHCLSFDNLSVNILL